jgi:hypothetical protein
MPADKVLVIKHEALILWRFAFWTISCAVQCWVFTGCPSDCMTEESVLALVPKCGGEATRSISQLHVFWHPRELWFQLVHLTHCVGQTDLGSFLTTWPIIVSKYYSTMPSAARDLITAALDVTLKHKALLELVLPIVKSRHLGGRHSR